MRRLAHAVLVLPCALAVSQFDTPGYKSERVSDAAARKPYETKYAGAAPVSCDEPTVEEHRPQKAESLHEIFLVPHTHDDVGWLYTIGGYYNRSVRYILDSVTADLGAHPSHRFIWSEIKWIEMWWPQQNASTRQTFKRIVANGQLEFVGAGWSQHDEVTPSYRDMAGNTQHGHEFLRQILGALDKACPAAGRGRCVRFGWQIDMFAGYTAASPALDAMTGYDGMVIRFEGPNEMRAEWDAKQEYEFVWQPSAHLSPERSHMACHVIRWNYGDMLLEGRNGSRYGYRGPDVSFGFDTLRLHTHADVEKYAAALVRWSKGRGSVYRGNRHLAPWGADFQFTDAGVWFRQMDQIIAEINGHPQKYGAHIRYSTLATYFDHLHALNAKGAAEGALPLKTRLDFQYGWPHTWAPEGVPLIGLTRNFSWQYQTGAASSRPAHKQHARASAARLRTAQTAHALALARGALRTSAVGLFDAAWDALGVAQHHDSLPGTMQTDRSVECPDNVPILDGIDACNRTTGADRRVLEDYTARLEEADAATGKIILISVAARQGLAPAALSFEPPETQTPPPPKKDLRPSSLLRHFSTPNASSSTLEVVVVNPSAHARTERMRVEFTQPLPPPAYLIPSVYRASGGARNGSAAGPATHSHRISSDLIAIPAQLEVNDRLTSQLTGSHHPPHALTNALYFLATVPPLGLATYTLVFETDGPSNGEALRNSSTTVVPNVTVGAAAAAKIGLGYSDDPFCLRVGFGAADGLMQTMSMRHDGLGCDGTRAATAAAAPASTGAAPSNVTRARVRQTYFQYVDAVGGSYCLIEQSSAVEVPAPYRVALTAGPVFQEVVQSYGYGYGLQQRVRVVAPLQAAAAAAPLPTSKSPSPEPLPEPWPEQQTMPTVEVEHSAGRLGENRELISRIKTDLCSCGTLHTEASGFSELYPRPLNRTASVAQNYHSLVQTAVIRDETNAEDRDCCPQPVSSPPLVKGSAVANAAAAGAAAADATATTTRQLTVLTRRTMGVASLSDGQVEYMTMRRITTSSDNQGPWPLDDALPMEDTVRLMLAPQLHAEAARFPAALALEQPFTLLYKTRHATAEGAAAESSPGSPRSPAPLGFPPSVWYELLVRADAPPNATYVLRVQNVVAGGPSVVVPSLRDALGLLSMTACVEVTLSLQETRAANDAVRLRWKPQQEDGKDVSAFSQGAAESAKNGDGCSGPVHLDSLDLRTFTFAA